jgi:hypothetical protein
MFSPEQLWELIYNKKLIKGHLKVFSSDSDICAFFNYAIALGILFSIIPGGTFPR